MLLTLILFIALYFVIKKINSNKKQKELKVLQEKYPKKAEEFWTHMAIQSHIDKKINKK